MSSGFKEFVRPSDNISFSNQYKETKTVTINGNGLLFIKLKSKSSIEITNLNIDNKGEFYTNVSISPPLQIYFTESITITFYANTSSNVSVALSDYYGYYLY